MSTATEIKSQHGGARANAGRPPYRSSARGENLPEFLRAVVADTAAPLSDRLKAAATLERIEARLAEEREDARLRRENRRLAREVGL